MTLSKILADFVVNCESFSDEALYLAKKSIIDSMGAMIIGSKTHLAEKAEYMAGRDGSATIVGFGDG